MSTVETHSVPAQVQMSFEGGDDGEEFGFDAATEKIFQNLGVTEPMSDIADISPHIEISVGDQTSDVNDQTDTQRTVRRFMTRPEYDEQDEGVGFSIAPIKPNQRNFRGKAHPAGLLHYPQHNQQSGTFVDSDKDCQHLPSPNASHPSTQTCIDIDIAGQVANIYVLPIKQIHSTLNSERNSISSNESRSVQCCNRDDQALELSTGQKTIRDHNGSNTETLLEANIPCRSTSAESSESSRSNTSPARSGTTIEEETMCSTTEQAEPRQSETSGLHGRSHGSLSPARAQCRRSPLRYSPDDKYRVTKPSLSPPGGRRQETTFNNTSDPKITLCGTPSVEDYLHLAMYRFKQQLQVNAEELERHRNLEKQNQELRQARKALQDELGFVAAERDGMLDSAEAAQNELELFKNKYKKIKAWALEMNNEYAAIRQEGADMKASLAELRKQHTEFWKPVQTELASNQMAKQSIANVKQGLTETHETLDALQNDLTGLRTTIAQKNNEASALRSIHQEHKAYIMDLSRSQKQYNDRTVLRQEQLNNTLCTLSDKVDQIQPQPVLITQIGECLQLLEGLAAREASTTTNLKDLCYTVQKLEQQLKIFETDVAATLQPSEKPNIPDSLINDMTVISEAIKDLKPDVVRFQNLLQENAKLQEKVKGHSVARELIEQAKIAAETHQANVQGNNNKLIDSIANLSGSEQEQRTRLHSAITSELSAIITSNNAAQTKLSETETKLRSCEEESTKLKQRLEECERVNVSNHQALRDKYEQELNAAKEETKTKEKQIQIDLGQQLHEKDEAIAQCHEALKVAQIELASSKETILQLNATYNELQQQAQAAKTNHIECIEDLEKQQELSISLSEQLKAVKRNVSTIPDLKREIAEKNKKLAKLQNDHSELTSSYQELHEKVLRNENQANAIAELEKKLHEAEQKAHVISELEEQIKRFERDSSSRESILLQAQAKASMVDELEKKVKMKDSDFNRIYNQLEDLQKNYQELQNAQLENDQLKSQIVNLQQDAEATKSRMDQLTAVENLSRQQANTIGDLEKQVAIAQNIQIDLDSLKVRLIEKDEQLLEKNNEIEKLRTQQVHNDRSQESDLNGDLDEFFTQNTNLSIPTHAGSNNQNEDFVRAHLSTTDGNTSLPEVVDPRVIMTATPLDNPAKTQQANCISLSQSSIIPDSQLNHATNKIVRLENEKGSGIEPSSSSPLSDLSEKCLRNDLEVDQADSEDEDRASEYANNNSETDDVFQLPSDPPTRRNMDRIIGHQPRRASSIMSQEEMLLLGSDLGRQRTPQFRTAQHAHPTTSRLALQSRAIQAENDGSSQHDRRLRRLRSNLQTQTVDENTRPAEMGEENRQVTAREPNRPNSAVKRRTEDNIPDTSDRVIGKRLKLRASQSKRDRFDQPQRDNLNASPLRPNDNLSTSTCHGSVRHDGVISPPKATKRSKTTRKASKQDKYAARFGSGS